MKKNRVRRGFTLVEMLAVMAMIMALAGIIIVVARGAAQKAERVRAKAEVLRLKKAFEDDRLERGIFWGGPGEKDQNVSDAKSDIERYLDSDAKVYTDPWGTPYKYWRISDYNAIVYSYGPDAINQTSGGVAGAGNDDIRSDRSE